jgi:hypothetical protein
MGTGMWERRLAIGAAVITVMPMMMPSHAEEEETPSATRKIASIDHCNR